MISVFHRQTLRLRCYPIHWLGRFRLFLAVAASILLAAGAAPATTICQCSSPASASCVEACAGNGGKPVVILFPNSPDDPGGPKPLSKEADWNAMLTDGFSGSELESFRDGLEQLRIRLEESREETELLRQEGEIDSNGYNGWMKDYRSSIENYQQGIEAYRNKVESLHQTPYQ